MGSRAAAAAARLGRLVHAGRVACTAPLKRGERGGETCSAPLGDLPGEDPGGPAGTGERARLAAVGKGAGDEAAPLLGWSSKSAWAVAGGAVAEGAVAKWGVRSTFPAGKFLESAALGAVTTLAETGPVAPSSTAAPETLGDGMARCGCM